MHLYILYLTTVMAVTDATFANEWNSQGRPSGGNSSRCNSLPAGHCCGMGQKRVSDRDSSTTGASEAGHLGYIDAEEAALPPVSYHKPDGEQISKEEFDRMSALEFAHEANGTLYLLYPDFYPSNYMDYYHLPSDNPTFAEDFEDVNTARDTCPATVTLPTSEARGSTTAIDTKALVCQQAVPR